MTNSRKLNNKWRFLYVLLFITVVSQSGTALCSPIWKQIGNVINGEVYDDLFGRSVSLNADGTVVAIGAPGYEYDSFIKGAGYVRVYENISGTWTQVGDDIDGEAERDGSGSSVSLNADGTVVAIAAGHVWVYKNISGTWTQVGDKIYDIDRGGGRSVSLSADGTVVAIGNVRWGEATGYVRVFSQTEEFPWAMFLPAITQPSQD